MPASRCATILAKKTDLDIMWVPPEPLVSSSLFSSSFLFFHVLPWLPAAMPAAPAAPSGGDAADVSKRLRNLTKKLKQIEELKAKAAGGAALDEGQREKVAQEGALRREVAELEAAQK